MLVCTPTGGLPAAFLHWDRKTGILSFKRAVPRDIPITATEIERSEREMLREYLTEIFGSEACTEIMCKENEKAIRLVDTLADETSFTHVMAVTVRPSQVPERFFVQLDAHSATHMRLAEGSEVNVYDSPATESDDPLSPSISSLEYELMLRTFKLLASAGEKHPVAV